MDAGNNEGEGSTEQENGMDVDTPQIGGGVAPGQGEGQRRVGQEEEEEEDTDKDAEGEEDEDEGAGAQGGAVNTDIAMQGGSGNIEEQEDNQAGDNIDQEGEVPTNVGQMSMSIPSSPLSSVPPSPVALAPKKRSRSEDTTSSSSSSKDQLDTPHPAKRVKLVLNMEADGTAANPIYINVNPVDIWCPEPAVVCFLAHLNAYAHNHIRFTKQLWVCRNSPAPHSL